MKKYLLALTMVVTLAGCAGMGGNEAYSEAHKAAERRGIAEANATAKATAKAKAKAKAKARTRSGDGSFWRVRLILALPPPVARSSISY